VPRALHCKFTALGLTRSPDKPEQRTGRWQGRCGIRRDTILLAAGLRVAEWVVAWWLAALDTEVPPIDEIVRNGQCLA